MPRRALLAAVLVIFPPVSDRGLNAAGPAAGPLGREGVGPGDTVHSIGSPGASDALWAYTPGAVKAVYKKSWAVRDRNEIHNFEANVVETTSPVNPGDSGGPLLNGQGE